MYDLADGDKGRVSIRIKEEGEGKWRVQAKVANSMNCMVTEEGGVFTPGHVMSTRMLPPPDLQELEKEISKMISELTKISKDGIAF